MTTPTNCSRLLIAFLLFATFTIAAQTSSAQGTSTVNKKTNLKTYLIEREIPNAGKFTVAELKGITQKSCSVLKEMGPGIEWLHSYVTGNKIYCVYKAENEELIKVHGNKGGFPVTSITEISTIIGPEY